MKEKGFAQSLIRSLGLHKNPAYVEDHLKLADVKSAAFLGFIVSGVEVWMLIRYVYKYVLTGICETVGDFFRYTQGYWQLLFTSILLCVYGYLYVKGKLKILNRASRLFIFLYFAQGIYFGLAITRSDLGKGRMIMCFLTMISWLTVICVWRPVISVALCILTGSYFVYFVNHYVTDTDGSPYHLEEGNLVNYITFLLVLMILTLSVYYQRYSDASTSYRLKLSAITDRLTGIPNMSCFSDESTECMREAFDKGVPPVFLVFNIVNFQTYNDRFGYTGGNKLLQTMGRIVAEHFADGPYARLSDDYFVAFTGKDDYKARVKKVKDALKKAYSSETYLDVNAAFYVVKRRDLEPRHAIDRARYALSFLKHHDETFLIEYDDTLRDRYKLRQYVLNNIDTAVAQGYIKVYYQPVIWSEDETLCGFEALARWDDPVMGFLSPGQFIPILEESRQIHKLDRCIYESVCKNMRACMDAGLPVLPTSLNFSRLDFELMDAVGELEALVAKYKISRELLHVEITESALSEDIKGLQSAMATLHEKGYMIWLDDFGSGYSSMNVLKDFKFDLLKIDMEFLKNFSGNEKAYLIIDSIIRLADQLGMMTLTEGVETKEAVEFLRNAGCGRLQGFLFGRPMPYDEVIQKIKANEYMISPVLH
ncbi:MAG: EAL domain-containing protein [Lachnospiraceae bacterium]|nr:EAL domain-containing protein [Lachnospiraceae bacterium]